MAGTAGPLAMGGGDPRSSAGIGTKNDGAITRHEIQKLHDPSVTFEEYLHYAAITRADTRYEQAPQESKTFTQKLNPWNRSGLVAAATSGTKGEKIGIEEKDSERSPQPYHVSEEEYINASRAVRTATWGAVFYLITTDILGPWSTAWAFRQMGYGPGVVLYTVFGLFAAYGGYLLWKMFLRLDSDRYPLKSYGDIAFRVYGSSMRHAVNFLQSFQLLFNVGIIMVLNGQGLSQLAAKRDGTGRVCYIILCFIWAISGMIAGQIRTLQRLGWLANAAIWMNIIVIISSMVVAATDGPNYVAAEAQYSFTKGPIVRTAGPPSDVAFDGQLVGLMQAVYSYGGAMLFIEFMSEMRRPFDFWKGMICAQLFIYFVYLLYGLFIYTYQGQFVINPSYQSVAPFHWQIVCNTFALVSGLIAALLYGNIGIKVIYNNVLIDIFNFPSLAIRRGKILWCFIVPIYWGVAFVIAAGIPQVSNLSGFIAAACILQFSYTFPPMIMLGFQVKQDAIQHGEGFDPASGHTIRQDLGLVRWKRGFAKNMVFNCWNVFFFLGSLTTAVLGLYSSIKGMKDAYAKGSSTGFSCHSPVLAG